MRHTHPLPTVHRTTDVRGAVLRATRTAATLALLAAAVALAPQRASAADEPQLERLATCKDSWFDWKDSGVRMTQFVNYVESRLKSDDGGQSFEPSSPIALFGVPVLQAYPQSVGMGVGFSVVLDIDLQAARKIFEKQLGRPMTCARSDGIESCELPIGAQRTAMLMTNVEPGRPTLAGCYYFYQK